MERRQIRQQLDAVHSSINQLSGPALMAAATTGGPGAAGGPTMESLLGNIASRLASIEGMYAGMTGKLDKVDNRVEDSERNIRDLQHFSAGTIQETARLVDYLGGRATPPASRASMAGTARRHAAAAAAAPPPAMALPRSPLPALDYVPGHLSGTIQQHASQIHKLIAGLDFLESHIIRHDQAIEAVQKQVLVSSPCRGPISQGVASGTACCCMFAVAHTQALRGGQMHAKHITALVQAWVA